MGIESRDFSVYEDLKDVELREAEDGSEGKKLSGWAPKWNRWSKPLPGLNGETFVERFAPGAFTNLDSEDIVVTFEHDNSKLLGRTSSGTASVSSTNSGLSYSVDLPNTSTGNDLREWVGRGDISGSSFEFIVEPDGEVWEKKGKKIQRTVTGAKLFQVGPVTKPAYPTASSVSIRGWEALEEQEKRDRAAERERRLRLADADSVD